MQDGKWATPNADPVGDLIKTIEEEREFTPLRIPFTTEQVITLAAMDNYCAWKAKWRRQHKILYFLEKISNKIRVIK